MDILVTGGNGFIGSNLINRLIEEGHYVISIDNLSTGKKENTVSHASYLYADINDIIPKKINKTKILFILFFEIKFNIFFMF